MMETLFGLDYPTIWFMVVGALFSGYAILDGFDFGAGAWHLFFKKEQSRRIGLNAIGPVWDGNEVWLVIGGGALFAGFPVMYAAFLSALYIPFMLFLFLLILRAISIEFRSKEDMLWWRKTWDYVYGISSIMLAFLLGVVLGNVLQGIQIGADYQYEGAGFFEFLNPFAIMVGSTTLSLFMLHGAIYLLLKTEHRLYAKLTILVKRVIVFFLIIFSVTTMYALEFIPHLYNDIKANLWLAIFPLSGFISIAVLPRLIARKRFRYAFLFSTLTISFMLMTVAVELYPNLLLSSIESRYNIDIYNAASSIKTLKIMLTMVAVGGPLVLAYTLFVYKVFSGRVQLDETSY